MEESSIDFSCQACAGGNQSLGGGLQDFRVNPRLVIEALNIGEAREVAQVSVTRFIFCEQDEMEVGLSAAFLFSIMATAICDVSFHANDGFDALLSTSLVKLDCAVHVSMICEGQSFHSLILGQSDHIRNRIDPIQQTEMAVDMKMAESIGDLGQVTSAEVGTDSGGTPRCLFVLWGAFPLGKVCDSLM